MFKIALCLAAASSALLWSSVQSERVPGRPMTAESLENAVALGCNNQFPGTQGLSACRHWTPDCETRHFYVFDGHRAVYVGKKCIEERLTGSCSGGQNQGCFGTILPDSRTGCHVENGLCCALTSVCSTIRSPRPGYPGGFSYSCGTDPASTGDLQGEMQIAVPKTCLQQVETVVGAE